MKHIYAPAKMHPKLILQNGTLGIIRSFAVFLLPLLIFSGCMEDDFDENDLRDVCPRVTSRAPAAGDSGVRIDSHVIAEFNKSMNPESFDKNTTFIVRDDAGLIPGDLNITEQTVVFEPRGFLPQQTLITVEIKKEVADFYDFNLEGDVIWTFTTGSLEDIKGPYVIARSPRNGATNVVLNSHIIAEFNEPLNPATVNSDNFMVYENGNAIQGTLFYEDQTAWFVPLNYLAPNTTYEVLITTGIMDPMGNAMENDESWSFTTGTTIEPIPNSCDISKIEEFVILSGRYIRNLSGTSSITGNVGLYPGVYDDIFDIDTILDVDGTVYVTGNVPVDGLPGKLIRAKADLKEAYHQAREASDPTPVSISGDQGGNTLTPGIYKTQQLLVQSGDLTLDAQGNPHSFWIFQVDAYFETSANIILEGGADPRNIFWQVGIRDILGPNVIIGENTQFFGNILSKQGISVGENGIVHGRLLVKDGGVRLHNSTIVIP